jgi:predicted nucleic acid-binding protein
MALVCDTGGVYALYDADDKHYPAAKRVVEAEAGPLYLPVVLLAEIDYLLTTRLGIDAALDFLQSVESLAFTLVALTTEDLTRCCELVGQYRDMPLGIADAAVVATAERLKIPRLLSVDQRHFRAVKPRGLNNFILLPTDQEG